MTRSPSDRLSVTSSYFRRVYTMKTGIMNKGDICTATRSKKPESKTNEVMIPSLDEESNLRKEKMCDMKTRGSKHKGSNGNAPTEVQEKKRKRPQIITDVNYVLPLPVREESAGEGFPKYGPKRLQDDFYDVPCEQLAKALLGCILVRRLSDDELLKARIVETECYLGGEDKASHSCGGRVTERNRPMYMKPGTTYVYFTYGMYHCFNISSQGPGAAVLLRALDPIEGVGRMLQERAKIQKKKKTTEIKPLRTHEVCNGPGKLCLSFCLDKVSCNAQDLSQWGGMWVEKDEALEPFQIVTSTRIGIDSVQGEWVKKPLRFYILGNPSVSRRDRAREKELQDSACSSS